MHGDLKFEKSRSDETDKCLRDYDIEAFSNCFLDLRRLLSDNGMNEVLHTMLKHENQFYTFLSTNTNVEAICAFHPPVLITNYILRDLQSDM